MSTRQQTPTASRAPTGLRRPLALAGLIGPILFVVTFTFLGAVRPGYSAMRDAISDLGVGEGAWVQNLNFLVFGALMVAFAAGFRMGMLPVAGPRTATVGSALIALTGAGIIASAAFPAAPPTQMLHFLAGFLVAFGSAVATSAYVGRRLRRVAGWQGAARYSIATAVAAVALIAFSFSALNPSSPLEEAGVGGLIERALTVVVFAWHAVFGWLLFRRPATTPRERP